ncbi:hypothetical protein C8R44DRAFT_879087 [Mycena epipterygia]|nr:hypothetical protein C8R44DRAFT_879087 [Mycena epipterygia]
MAHAQSTSSSTDNSEDPGGPVLSGQALDPGAAAAEQDPRRPQAMTVEKGLLRETRGVHRMLIACRFYLDDLKDTLALTALRMPVKDLLIPFQA